MKAIIIFDRYDPAHLKENLISELAAYGIKDVLLFENLDELKENFNSLTAGELHLFFPNIFIRYRNIPNILQNSKSNFEYFKVGRYITAFRPECVSVSREGIRPLNPLDKSVIFFFYRAEHKIIYFKKMKAAIPHIMIYTHNRPEYFKLTLNSILYSTSDCPEVPISIILNDPTPEVMQVAANFMGNKRIKNILKVEENAAYAGFNVGMQWIKPEYAILAEDDFILPETTKFIYPFWPLQFTHRLNFMDYLGWRPCLNNIPHNVALEWENYVPKTRLGWKYQKGTETNFILLAQNVCFKTDYYVKNFEPSTKAVTDTTLKRKSEIIGTPFLPGYHIGWNLLPDNLFSREKTLKGYNQKLEVVNVTELRSNISKKINLNDLKNLDI